MSEHYNTFTWCDTKQKKIGVVMKTLYLFGMLLVSALFINIVINIFEIITK